MGSNYNNKDLEIKGRVDWNEFGKTMQKSLTLGQTLKGTDLQNLMRAHTSITCGIAIENWTSSELSSPQYTSCTGMLSIPPRSIGSGSVQAVVRSLKNKPINAVKTQPKIK
ncbi:Hypothetical predicted protein [Mytilus galloprovincialis]|uniref:Uncharacterized protein n=2 Tax=Mytilus galloprovincialis TaxID=29158 RepID=A0A8B6BGS6_MYTGA|nr:Hypothetical predicted protein [Mytilus galloprovincialis]